jgi:hypothetical protein
MSFLTLPHNPRNGGALNGMGGDWSKLHEGQKHGFTTRMTYIRKIYISGQECHFPCSGAVSRPNQNDIFTVMAVVGYGLCKRWQNKFWRIAKNNKIITT